jgi:hypothetical protein
MASLELLVLNCQYLSNHTLDVKKPTENEFRGLFSST